MDLETSDGTHKRITSDDLPRLLAQPVPLLVLRGPGIALVALHNQDSHYALLYWNGRVWQRTDPEIHESLLNLRLSSFIERRGDWRTDLSWETYRPRQSRVLPLTLSCGAHVFVSFLLTLGGFTAGVALGFATGRHTAPYDSILVYVFAAVMGPLLAILGQSLAEAIPAACDACDEPAISLRVGRFAYLCTECGHIRITRWGINRSLFGT